MEYFQVFANGVIFGTYQADSHQAAIDMCCADAGYKNEADMISQLEYVSELETRVVCLDDIA